MNIYYLWSIYSECLVVIKKNRLSFDLQFTEQLPEPDLTLPQYFANLLFLRKSKNTDY